MIDLPDIGHTFTGVPYQSVLFRAADVMTASGCVLSSNSTCDLTISGEEWRYDGMKWYVYSTTSVCCGYDPNALAPPVEQFITNTNQMVEVDTNVGYVPPTLKQLIANTSSANYSIENYGTTSGSKTGGGIPLLLMGAVGVVAIAGVAMSQGGKGSSPAPSGGTT